MNKRRVISGLLAFGLGAFFGLGVGPAAASGENERPTAIVEEAAAKAEGNERSLRNAQRAVLSEAKETVADDVVVRVVRYAFSVQNLGETALRDVRLRVMAPARQTPTQRCLRMTSRPTAERGEDDLGNQALVFVFPSIGPHATEIVRVEAELALHGTPVPEPLAAEWRRLFSMPQPHIECDRPAIVALANAHARATVPETVEALHAWVMENIQRDLPTARDHGARRTLERRRGDCTDMAYLLAALCRARGIPARVMAGFIVERHAVLRPDAFHNWIEFHDGEAWRVADPFAARFNAAADTYIVMRILDGRVPSALGDWQRFHIEPQGAVRVRMLRE